MNLIVVTRGKLFLRRAPRSAPPLFVADFHEAEVFLTQEEADAAEKDALAIEQRAIDALVAVADVEDDPEQRDRLVAAIDEKTRELGEAREIRTVATLAPVAEPAKP